MVEEFPNAVTIRTGMPISSVGQGVQYLRRLPSKAPYAVTKFTSSQVSGLLATWDREKRFDVVLCDFLAASLNVPKQIKTPVLLFQHNVESALWTRQARHERNLAKRMAFKVESIKMNSYERSAVRRFDHVIAVSDHDRNLMSDMTAADRISVVPTGVDLEQYFVTEGAEPSEEGRILFLGSMDWEANIDGVDYFCQEIWPSIKAAVPNAKFSIVGRNPPARINRWASEDIEITGRVNSVVPYLKRAAVFVVPLRIGGGTRLKIYEAMAAGKAVVSTSVGAEGLDVTHGKDILLADDSESFSKAVVELLRDRQSRCSYEKQAASLAAQFDWAVIAKQFEEILARAIQRSRRNGMLHR